MSTRPAKVAPLADGKLDRGRGDNNKLQRQKQRAAENETGAICFPAAARQQPRPAGERAEVIPAPRAPLPVLVWVRARLSSARGKQEGGRARMPVVGEKDYLPRKCQFHDSATKWSGSSRSCVVVDCARLCFVCVFVLRVRLFVCFRWPNAIESAQRLAINQVLALQS